MGQHQSYIGSNSRVCWDGICECLDLNDLNNSICGLLGHKMSSTTSYNTSSSSVHISNSRQGVINLTLKLRLVDYCNLPRSPLQHPGSNSVHTPGGCSLRWVYAVYGGEYPKLSYRNRHTAYTRLQYNHSTYRDRIAVTGRIHISIFFHIHTHLLSAHFTVHPYNHINK